MRRLVVVLRVFFLYGLDRFIPQGRRLWWHRLILGGGRWLLAPVRNPPQSKALALRLALECLGPVFIKFGQILSTRRDLLDDDLIEELCRLHDQLAAVAPDAARAQIEKALGQSIEACFQFFEAQALAAASVAQVHRARLHDGQEVIVKFIRDDVRAQIDKDVYMLRRLAAIMTWLYDDSGRLRAGEVVDDFAHTLYAELDMRQEAANCATMAQHFAHSNMLRVPKIHWPLVRPGVLVQEYLADVVSIDEVELMRERGVDFRRLAENGTKIFYTQAFQNGFFHADMHPGNILVDITDPANPRYAGVDFGIVGVLQERDIHYLGLNMLAFFRRDYALITRLHIESGWLPKSTRSDHFEQAVRSVCEPLHALPIAEVSFASLIVALFQVARRFSMVVQPQLLLFQKTLTNVEGMGRLIYPELDLWTTVLPELKKWQAKRLSPRRLAARARADVMLYAAHLPNLPRQMVADHQKRQRLFDAIEELSAFVAKEQIAGRRFRRALMWFAVGVAATWMVLVFLGTNWIGNFGN